MLAPQLHAQEASCAGWLPDTALELGALAEVRRRVALTLSLSLSLTLSLSLSLTLTLTLTLTLFLTLTLTRCAAGWRC